MGEANKIVRGHYSFELIDIKQSRLYWIGKKPNTIKAFNHWLHSNLTMKETATLFHITDATIQTHSTNLQRKGILKKSLIPRPDLKEQNARKAKRSEIKRRIQHVTIRFLDKILDVLDNWKESCSEG